MKKLSDAKRDRVINQLRQNVSPSEIARNCRISRSMVYNIKNELVDLKPLAKRDSVKRSELQWTDLKAMENWHANLAPDTEMVRTECLGCKRIMWTRDIKLEDLCEECGYGQFLDSAEATIQRELPRMHDPFGANDTGGLFN